MRDRNAGVPQDRRIEFRIGVNLGDVIVEGEDIFGDGVNVAAGWRALRQLGGSLSHSPCATTWANDWIWFSRIWVSGD